MEPSPESIVKRHVSGCISYRDAEGKIQMWRPEFVRSAGHIYIVTNPTYGYLDRYRVGYTELSIQKFKAHQDIGLGNTTILAFLPGTSSSAADLARALSVYRVPPSEEVVIPIGNLLSLIYEVLRVRPEIPTTKNDIRPLVKGAELGRHLTVFIKIHRQERLRREVLYLAFCHEYLRPLSLFANFEDFCLAVRDMGYKHTHGDALVPVRESIVGVIRTLTNIK